jgi:hypothetical protein
MVFYSNAYITCAQHPFLEWDKIAKLWTTFGNGDLNHEKSHMQAFDIVSKWL